jgi:hypothetical protein
MAVVARVLFRRDPLTTVNFVGQLLRADIPVVLCGYCGRGVAIPIVNQVCSAGCGAYVYEVLTEGEEKVSGGWLGVDFRSRGVVPGLFVFI